MFKSLYSKIAAGLAVLFLLTGLIFISVTVFSTDMYQQEVNQKLNDSLADQIVKEWLLMEQGKVNTHALKEIFHMLMVINPGIEIYLLDPDGKILTYSAPKGSVKRDKVSLEPIVDWMNRKDSVSPIQGEDPKSLVRKKVFSAAPIKRNDRLEGYLYVILGGEQYDSVVDKLKESYIIQLSAWMILAGLLFTFVSGLVLFALLTLRLKKLDRIMDAFRSESRMEHPDIPVKENRMPTDEIDRLTQTFQKMAVRIESQMDALNASDKMRRELVANVSHDLKTPLATLQGYIETLLIKENHHSPEQRQQYLEIAIKHCQRLNHLVSDLLELAQVESARFKIRPEAFNLDELAGDIVQKFTLKARERQIRLETRSRQESVFVMADIALIERALENLIENALRHTPENGRVSIDISHPGEQDLMVSITDTGPGIPEDQLKYIFKRYYHSGKSKDGGKKHLGLGLAITRRIIQLHQRELKVKTEPGKGTCFSFHLPVAGAPANPMG